MCSPNDRFDAFVLADALRTDGWRWRAMPPSSDLHAELRAVVRHRRQCYRTQIRAEAQLRETLLAYHPAVTALFSSIERDATLAFLRDYPNPEAAGRVGEARMAGFCRRIGYSGRVPPAELVERMRTNLLAGSPGSRAGHEFAALAQAEHLALLNDQLRRFNRRIDELLDHISPQHSSNSCSPTPTASTPTSETNPNWPLRFPRMIRRAV